MKVEFSGPVCEAAFGSLAPRVLEETRGARTLAIRMDSCLMLTDRPPAVADGYQGNTAPGCVIVRADQFDIWSDYAAMLAQVGIRRIVFLDSQLHLARLWVERRSLLHVLPAL